MKGGCFLSAALVLAGIVAGQAEVVLEISSAYHHIQVVDEGGLRTLSFDGSMETRMSLANPLEGHFQYIDFFHLPWLWNSHLTNILMIGLGGGSIQRAYQHYYPELRLDTVELDPVVVQVAKEYFHVKESPTLHITVQDGRLFLRRTSRKYDAILMDAYEKNRYGSFIPYHLVSREFFELARDHLGTNGVLAYNVIGTLGSYRADLMGAVYKTLKEVFPQVYLFPAAGSYNVVLIATRSQQKVTTTILHQRTSALEKQGRRLPPRFRSLINAFRTVPPPTADRSPVLTDDFAPVDGLLQGVRPRR